MQNSFKVNRPLLNVHRFEIRQFVRFWKLPIYSDQSNQKTNYLRNKIRKQLMPTLRILFNPQIDTVLLNFVEIQKNEQLYFRNVLKLLLIPQKCHSLFVFSFNLSNPYCSVTEYDCFDNSFLSDLFFLAWYFNTIDQKNFQFSKEKASSASLFTESKQGRGCITWIYTKEHGFIQTLNNQKSDLNRNKKDCAKLIIQYKNCLDYFSRNQILYWLIINNNFIKRLNSYPNIFQKQVLKTILKTFNQVENAINSITKSTHYLSGLNRRFTDQKFERVYQNKQLNEQKLTQLLILKFTKNLFVSREKKFLLITLQNLINKY